MDAPITPHAIATPHPTLATTPTGTTHATPWTGAILILATQHNDTNPGKSHPRPSTPYKLHHPKTVTIQDSHSDSSSECDSDSDPLNY